MSPADGWHEGVVKLEKIETQGEEINVEEIMRRIRENIKRRREGEGHSADPASGLEAEQEVPVPEAATQRDLEYLNSNWDIQNKSYFISSHRRLAGQALMKGRELVHGEVRRYVDPMIWKQKEFNERAVHVLNQASKSVEGIYSSMRDLKREIDQVREGIPAQIEGKLDWVQNKLAAEMDGRLAQNRIAFATEVDEKLVRAHARLAEEMDGKLAQSRSAFAAEVDEKLARAHARLAEEMDGRLAQSRSAFAAEVDEKLARAQARLAPEIREQVGAVIAAMNEDIENRAWLAGILDRRIAQSREVSSESPAGQNGGMNYFLFEERFRGPRADIKGRQRDFLKYFEGSKSVLDIGCGRGEFLELLREQGMEGRGIDVDEDMVNFCRSKGLDAEQTDAISYLERLEDKSLGGIFIDQVVEHLEPEYLVRMIRLCYRKLIYGGAIVAETVNPLSFFSFANFYIDMSHKRPVHPETLRFIIGSAGFREIELRFSSPMKDDMKLMKIDDNRTEKDAYYSEIYNRNIDMINSILFGPQDYFMVGRK